jgi:hypothetical protein
VFTTTCGVTRINGAGAIIVTGAVCEDASDCRVTSVNSTFVVIIADYLFGYAITSNTGLGSTFVVVFTNNRRINTFSRRGARITTVGSARVTIATYVGFVNTSGVSIARIVCAKVIVVAVYFRRFASFNRVAGFDGTFVAIIANNNGMHASNIGKTVIRGASIVVIAGNGFVHTSRGRIAGVRSTIVSIITRNLSMLTSSLRSTSILGACIVIITTNRNMLTSSYIIARICSTFVIIVTVNWRICTSFNKIASIYRTNITIATASRFNNTSNVVFAGCL